MAALQVSSMRLITKGVANTRTPRLPRASAVSSCVTTCSISAESPAGNGMGLLLPD